MRRDLYHLLFFELCVINHDLAVILIITILKANLFDYKERKVIQCELRSWRMPVILLFKFCRRVLFSCFSWALAIEQVSTVASICQNQNYGHVRTHSRFKHHYSATHLIRLNGWPCFALMPLFSSTLFQPTPF